MVPLVVVLCALSQEELAHVRMDNNPAEVGYGVVAPVPTVFVGTVGGAVRVDNATIGGWYQYDPIVFAASSNPSVVCLGKLFVRVPPPRLCLAGPTTSVWHCPDPQNSSHCFSHDLPGQLLDWRSSHAVAWYGTTAVVHAQPDAFEDVRQMIFCVALLAVIVASRTFTGMDNAHERYAKNWSVALASAVVVAAPVTQAQDAAHLVLTFAVALAAGAAVSAPTEPRHTKSEDRAVNVSVSVPPLRSVNAHIDNNTTAYQLLEDLGLPPATTVLYRGKEDLEHTDIVVPDEIRLNSAQTTSWAPKEALVEQVRGDMTVKAQGDNKGPPITLSVAYATTAGDIMQVLDSTCSFTRDGRPLGPSSPLLGPLCAMRQLSHREVTVIVAHAVIALSLPSAIGLAPIRLSRFLIAIGVLIDGGYQCERALWHVRRHGHGVRLIVQIAALAGVCAWAAMALIHPSVEAAAIADPGSLAEILISTLISLSAVVAGSLSWHV